MAHMSRIFQIESLSKLGEIVGVGVHMVAAPWLTRTSMAAPVVRYATISVRSQEEHLIFESIRCQRPAMAEDNRLTSAPVLVIDLRPVLGRNPRHTKPPSYCGR